MLWTAAIQTNEVFIARVDSFIAVFVHSYSFRLGYFLDKAVVFVWCVADRVLNVFKKTLLIIFISVIAFLNNIQY